MSLIIGIFVSTDEFQSNVNRLKYRDLQVSYRNTTLPLYLRGPECPRLALRYVILNDDFK